MTALQARCMHYARTAFLLIVVSHLRACFTHRHGIASHPKLTTAGFASVDDAGTTHLIDIDNTIVTNATNVNQRRVSTRQSTDRKSREPQTSKQRTKVTRICEEILSTEDRFGVALDYAWETLRDSESLGDLTDPNRIRTDSDETRLASLGLLPDHETRFTQLATYIQQMEVIRQINHNLRKKLRNIKDFADRNGSDWVQSGALQQLLDALKQVLPSFKFWMPYLQNYNAMTSLVGGLKRDSDAFNTLLKNFQANHPNRLSLLGCLITPVQRVPRYMLLLKALGKDNTGIPASYVQEVIAPLVAQYDSFGHTINSAIGSAAESQQPLVDLQAEYPKAKILEPWRKLITSTWIQVRKSGILNLGVWKSRTFTLTNDAIFITGNWKGTVKEISVEAIQAVNDIDVGDGTAGLEVLTRHGKKFVFKQHDAGKSMSAVRKLLSHAIEELARFPMRGT